MNRVVHFDIQADDPKRAAAFYSTVFGWKFNQWGDIEYWLVTTGDDSQPGINGALTGANPASMVTSSRIPKGISSVSCRMTQMQNNPFIHSSRYTKTYKGRLQ